MTDTPDWAEDGAQDACTYWLDLHPRLASDLAAEELENLHNGIAAALREAEARGLKAGHAEMAIAAFHECGADAAKLMMVLRARQEKGT